MQTCPVCGSYDQTQPVPAVVDSQTVYSTTAGSSMGVAYGTGGVMPVAGTYRTYTTGTTPLASMLSLPVPRRPSAMRAWGLVLTPLGAGLAVLLSIAPRSQQAHPGALWASVVAGLFLSAALWLPGVIFTIAGHSRVRTYTREAPLRELTWRVWASASYCARDHVVFLPDGTYAAPGLARSMMYNAARQALPAASNLR
jgi:hypothetical protein